jgi:glutaredoxin
MSMVGKCIGTALAALTLTCFGAVTSSAEIYKWVDAQGNVHFQDHPPSEAGKNADVEVRESSPHSPPSLPTAPSNISGRAATPEAAVQPPRTITAELYSVSWCPHCKHAREFLRSQGVSFTDYDIEKDAAALARKNELDPEKGVPFAIINGIKIHGFSQQAYASAMVSVQRPGAAKELICRRK